MVVNRYRFEFASINGELGWNKLVEETEVGRVNRKQNRKMAIPVYLDIIIIGAFLIIV